MGNTRDKCVCTDLYPEYKGDLGCIREDNCDECGKEVDCDCPVKDLKTDCVVYSGPSLDETDINTNDILTDVIIKIHSKFVALKEYVEKALRITNVGTGVNIYRGVNILGEREIKSIQGSGGIVITEDLGEKTIIINAPEPKEYDIKTLDTTSIYAGVTEEDNKNIFNFKGLKKGLGVNLTEESTYLEFSVDENFLDDKIEGGLTGYIKTVDNNIPDSEGNVLSDKTSIISTTLDVEKLQGQDIYKIELDSDNLNNLVDKVNIISDTLMVQILPNYTFKIDIPQDDVFRPIIVNGGYTGSEEDGTEARPFKTIQGAVIYYIGGGTDISPERLGTKIQIRAGTYELLRNLSVLGINIESDTGVIINVRDTNISGGWLADFDSLGEVSTWFTFRGGQYNLYNIGGIRNSGRSTVDASKPRQGKRVNLIEVVLNGATPVDKNAPIVSNPIIASGYGGVKRANNGEVYYRVTSSNIRSEGQHKLMEIGNNENAYFFDNTTFQSNPATTTDGQLASNLVAIKIQGGDIRFTNCSFYSYDRMLNTFCRYEGIGSQGGFMHGCTMEGRYTNFITLNSTPEISTFRIAGCGIGYSFVNEYIVYATSNWIKLTMTGNDFGGVGTVHPNIDLTKNNTISTTNFYSGAYVESLRRFNTIAEANVLPKGGAYILTSDGTRRVVL